MATSSISGVALVTPAASSAANAATSTAPAATSSATTAQSPADTVTISPEAQQALAAGGSTAAAPSGSADDGVDEALTALNDTSGAASVADQLKAFALVAQYVSSAQAGSAPPKDQAVAIAALFDSAFGQHAQQVFTELQSQMNWNGGDATANSIDTVLESFDALSAADQQVYIGALGLQHQLLSKETPITSVADFKANQQAHAEIERAIQAAESNLTYALTLSKGTGKGVGAESDELTGLAAAAGDQATVDLANLEHAKQSDTPAWTQQVQAYFAKYGPPPAANGATSSPSSSPTHTPASYQTPDGKTLATALAAINDTSGKTSLTDQLSAYQTLSEYMMFSADYGPARSAVYKAASASPLFAYASKLQDTMAAGLMSPGLGRVDEVDSQIT